MEVKVEVMEVMVEVVVDIVISKVCDLCIVIDSCNKINDNSFLMMSIFNLFVVVCKLVLVV